MKMTEKEILEAIQNHEHDMAQFLWTYRGGVYNHSLRDEHYKRLGVYITEYIRLMGEYANI